MTKIYIKELRDRLVLIDKTIHRKVCNHEKLTDMELLWFVYFADVTPVILKFHEEHKEKED